MQSITDAAQRLEAIRALLGHTALLNDVEWAELHEIEAAAFPYAKEHGERSVIGPMDAGDLDRGEKWLARYEQALSDAQRRAQVEGAPIPSIPTVELKKGGGKTDIVHYTTGTGQSTYSITGTRDTWSIHLMRSNAAPALDHRDGMRACAVALVDAMWPYWYGHDDADEADNDPRLAARTWLDSAPVPDWVRGLVQSTIADWEPDQRQWIGAFQRGERGAPTTLQLADRLGVSAHAFRPHGGYGEHEWLPEAEEELFIKTAERKAPRPVAVLHDHDDGVGDGPDGTPPATPGAAAMSA